MELSYNPASIHYGISFFTMAPPLVSIVDEISSILNVATLSLRGIQMNIISKRSSIFFGFSRFSAIFEIM